MKGYTIQNSINLLEKNAKGGGPSGPTSAENVTFDNTGTGLVADDVQSAIVEVNTKAENAGTYSTSETLIGTYKGKPHYRKVIHFESPLTVALNGTWVSTSVDISDIEQLTRVTCLSSFVWNLLSAFNNSGDLTLTSIVNAGSNTASVDDIIIEYTKVTTEAKKTRKK